MDDNKRLAWSATRVLCLLKGNDLTDTVDEAEDLMLSAASGQLDVRRSLPGCTPVGSVAAPYTRGPPPSSWFPTAVVG